MLLPKMKPCRIAILYPLLMLVTLLPGFSSSTVYCSENEKWGFSVVFPVVWVSAIDGTIDIGDNSLRFDTSFSDTLDSLSFGYMAEIYAQKGAWRYALKLNYAESEDGYTTRQYIAPPGIIVAPSHQVEIEKEEGTTDLTIGYQLDNKLLLFGGVRYIFSKIDVGVTPLGSGIIEIEGRFNAADENLYDWLLGIEYQHDLGNKWNLIINADASIAGDNDKDYSANLVLTYKLNELNTIWAGYRYFRVADKFAQDGVSIESDFITQGPTIGWAFTF